MKKNVILCLVTLFVFTFSFIKITMAVSDDSYIYYDGFKNEISFSNDDLFTDLKGLMPGDEKVQNVTLKVRNIFDITTLYLRVDQNNSNSFDIKTYADGKLIGTGDYVRLGSFSENDDISLRVVIKVPEETGNEIENLKYDVTWDVLVQKENTEVVDVPKTNDNIFIYVLLLILSILMMLFVFIKVNNMRRSK